MLTLVDGVEEIEDAVNLGFPPLSEKELALCHFDVKVDGFDCSRTRKPSLNA